jgi:ABC-2 type transport system permease protein
MGNVANIALRQFRSYFNGPVAYIVSCLVLLGVGAFFWYYFFLQGHAVAREMFDWLGWGMLFAAPALTMGLIAEEEDANTIELLMTMPVREFDVILGKFLGAYGMFVVLVLLTVPHPIAVATLGNLDWGPVLTGYLGVLLMGGAMLAIGLMTSSFTRYQLIAFFLSFGILVFLAIVPLAFTMLMTGTWASVFSTISLMGQLKNMARGVIDSRGVLYFISITVIALSIAFTALESRRWR